MNTPAPPRNRIFIVESALRQTARLIARSPSPEVIRHEILVRLRELITEEKNAAFRARIAAPGWSDDFAA